MGMVLQWTEDGDIITHMDGYITKLSTEYAEVRKFSESSIPANAELFAIDVESNPLSQVNRKVFHKIVAKLLYLCKRVRVDVQLPVLFLCTRVREPTVQD